jgi:hypothetical protein
MANMPKNTGKSMPSAVIFKGKVGQTYKELPVYTSTEAGPFTVNAGLSHGITELGDSKAKQRHKTRPGKTSERNELVFPHKRNGM